MLTIMSETDKVIAGPDVSSVGGQQTKVKGESAQTESAQPQTVKPESSESVQPEGTTEKSTAAIVPPGSSSSSSTVSSEVKTTVPISSLVPDQFKGSGYEDVIPYLERKINEYKPLSEEELKKLRRRQKAEGIISGISDAVRSVANLIFTNQYAPDMYKAENGMSARTKARFDKEKAEREANDDKWFNYVMTLGKLKNADRQQGLQIWQTEQSLARQDRERDDAIAFRNKDFDERVRQWQANFDRQDKWHKEESERWSQQFNESVRQFNVNSANERSRLGLEAKRMSQAVKQGQMTFNLGSGNGNVTLSIDKLNAQTVSRIYSTLPANVRAQVQGDPIVQNGFVVGYKPPTTEAMLIAIGANVESSPATQNAIKQVAGLETGRRPAGY